MKMTRKQVGQMMQSMGIPVIYRTYDQGKYHAPKPPYGVYYYVDSQDFYADCVNYARIERVALEVYSVKKDFEVESNIEQTLTEKAITWRRYDEYIDTEQLYLTTYEVYIMIDPEEG